MAIIFTYKPSRRMLHKYCFRYKIVCILKIRFSRDRSIVVSVQAVTTVAMGSIHSWEIVYFHFTDLVARQSVHLFLLLNTMA